jgi:hypothetical protein
MKIKKVYRNKSIAASAGNRARSGLGNFIGALDTKSGTALSIQTRQFFEPKMKHHFDGVKIHTGPAAAASAEAIQAKAYTYKNHIVFNEGQYQPDTIQGKKLLAHELSHIVQQSGRLQPMIQCERKLDGVEAAECLKKIETVIQALEKSVADPARKMPDYIKRSVEFLRKKMKDGKIGCYVLDGIKEGRTDLDTGEIQIDTRHIDETHILHEGVHGQHGVDNPNAAKKYAKALSSAHTIDTSKPLSEADKDLLRYKAWTEYWGYRSNYDYYNNSRTTPMTDDEIHKAVMSNRDVKLPVMEVWKFDSGFEPRTYKPKN